MRNRPTPLGQGSRAALIAREKGIPTLTGLRGLLSQIRSGDETLVGGDKAIPFLRLPFESNPLLGKRGVRVLLDYPQLARTQLKSLLRLSQAQDIRILVPMVTLERDMQQMRELLVSVAHEMVIQKLPPLGAMIETPAAALTVGQIARHADFLSVGTNDLTQYTLVAGRDNASVQASALIYRGLDDRSALSRSSRGRLLRERGWR